MKTSLDHLPAAKQRELEHVKAVLMAEFEAAVAGGTQPWRRGGRILKIILFGSFSRTDWVDEPANGYQSDWDLLVIVNHEQLTDIADYWYVAEDKLLRDPDVGRTVNIIVHTLAQVNQGLAKGEYFWTDIARDGVMLYELAGHPLAQPKPLTSADAYAMAQGYFSDWLTKVDDAIEIAGFCIEKGKSRDAAFMLHQAVERAYTCFLLVRTQYVPRSHNIKFLRSLAEDQDKRLVEAWPRDTRADRRRFELLKRAYVEARYSDAFEVSADDLEALSASASRLRAIVDELCAERLAALKDSAS